jgi:hypothetical protein
MEQNKLKEKSDEQILNSYNTLRTILIFSTIIMLVLLGVIVYKLIVNEHSPYTIMIGAFALPYLLLGVSFQKYSREKLNRNI